MFAEFAEHVGEIRQRGHLVLRAGAHQRIEHGGAARGLVHALFRNEVTGQCTRYSEYDASPRRPSPRAGSEALSDGLLCRMTIAVERHTATALIQSCSRRTGDEGHDQQASDGQQKENAKGGLRHRPGVSAVRCGPHRGR